MTLEELHSDSCFELGLVIYIVANSCSSFCLFVQRCILHCVIKSASIWHMHNLVYSISLWHTHSYNHTGTRARAHKYFYMRTHRARYVGLYRQRLSGRSTIARYQWIKITSASTWRFITLYVVRYCFWQHTCVKLYDTCFCHRNSLHYMVNLSMFCVLSGFMQGCRYACQHNVAIRRGACSFMRDLRSSSMMLALNLWSGHGRHWKIRSDLQGLFGLCW